MINRQYFFSGHFMSKDREDFSGVYTFISFRANAAEAMREVKEEIIKASGSKVRMHFNVFQRI